MLARTRPLIGYGGQIFNNHPELRSNVAGVFMGHSAQKAVELVDELLLNGTVKER